MNKEDYESNTSALESLSNIVLAIAIIVILYTSYEMIKMFNVLIGIFSGLGIGTVIIGSWTVFHRSKITKWYHEYYYEKRSAV